MIALTRAVGPALGRCELSHVERQPIDPELAAAQHAGYEDALRQLGCRVVRVPAAPDLPDAVFIEDTAVVVDELAVITRPGAPSRRAEVDAVGSVLASYRPLRFVEAPATLDGGDVLVVGEDVFVGGSTRTNREGAARLRAVMGEPLGYRVRRVPVEGCLHLKTAVTAVADDTLLLNPRWVDPGSFEGYRLVEVDPAEPFAANVLRVGDALLAAAAHPATRRRLAASGLRVETVDVSELAKAEAGVTCSAIILGEER